MIDPIQFRPYDPSTENRAIAVPDELPGFDANTARVRKDMQNYQQAERQNDRTRITESKLYGEDLVRLGQFSSSLTSLMQKGTEMYIESEKQAAATDALLGDQPISPEYEEEESAVIAEGSEEAPRLDEAEESGQVSATTARTYRKGSIWYQWERAKIDVQNTTATYGSWLKMNKETEIEIAGQKLSLATAETPAQYSAVQTALMQRFVKETGLGDMNPNLIAKYGRDNIQQGMSAARTEWAETAAKNAQIDRLNDNAAAAAGIVNGNQGAQAILDRFPKTAAGRRQAAAALVQAVQNGQITRQQAEALMGDDVTTGGGTKELAEMFPNEFGEALRDQLIKVDQGRRSAENRDRQLEAAEWKAGIEERLADLAKNGTYLTPEQEVQLIQEGQRYGFTRQQVDAMITNTSEYSTEQAQFQAERALDNPGLGPVSKQVFDRLDPAMQRKLADKGLAPESFATQPSKADVDEAKDYLGAVLSFEMEEASGLPQDRSPEYKLGLTRIEDSYRQYYAEEFKSNGGDSVAASRDAQKRIADEIKVNKGAAFTEPLSGTLGQKQQERLTQLEPFIEDPSKAETEKWATTTELEDAKEAIEKGLPLPRIFRYLSNGSDKVTARQLAEQQLGLAGMSFTPPAQQTIGDITAANDEQFAPLLIYKPTLSRATRYEMQAIKGLTPNDPEMLAPGVAMRVQSTSTNLSPTARGALDVLGKYESDSSGGYNAVNQIGLAGGHSTGQELGAFSGDYNNLGGMNLTDMTLKQIMELQAPRPGMSNADWINQGRLHAVGRYQFIGSTFKMVVRQMGLDPNTKFTPEIQDAMGIFHLKNVGIGDWVGPNSYASPEERQLVSQARRGM